MPLNVVEQDEGAWVQPAGQPVEQCEIAPPRLVAVDEREVDAVVEARKQAFEGRLERRVDHLDVSDRPAEMALGQPRTPGSPSTVMNRRHDGADAR